MRASERTRRLAVEDARFSRLRFVSSTLQWLSQAVFVLGLLLVAESLLTPPDHWGYWMYGTFLGGGLMFWTVFLQVCAVVMGAEASLAAVSLSTACASFGILFLVVVGSPNLAFAGGVATLVLCAVHITAFVLVQIRGVRRRREQRRGEVGPAVVGSH